MRVSSIPANSVTIKVLCMVFALISDINIKLNKISIIGFYLNWFSLHMMRWYCIRASLKQLENNSNYTSRILLFLCLASQYPPCLSQSASWHRWPQYRALMQPQHFSSFSLVWQFQQILPTVTVSAAAVAPCLASSSSWLLEDA